MAIRGSLSEASLADVLQLLALGQKTGVLHVACERQLAAVHFVRGAVVHAELVARRDRLGDRLVRRGAIAADALAGIIAGFRPADDRVLAGILRAQRLVDDEALTSAWRPLVEEVVYEIFTWHGGTFAFEPADTDDDAAAALVDLAVDGLLMEAARRADEWTQIAVRVPSLDVIFEADAARAPATTSSLSETARRLLALLDGTRDVEALAEHLGIDTFGTARALGDLVAAGLVRRVGRTGAQARPAPEHRVGEHRTLGIAFYRTGMYDEAAREFERVLALRADDGSARFHLGLVELRRGRIADARRLLAEASARIDAPAAAHLAHAYACEQCGDADAADAAYDAAARRGLDDDPRVALGQAYVALQRGDLPRAEERLERARTRWGARQPSAAWFHAAGLAAGLAGDYPRAVQRLEDGVAVHPRVTRLHNDLAVAQERAGLDEAAARTLEHALLEDSALPHLHRNLGDYHYRGQRYDEALAAYTRVVRLAPSHGAETWLRIGNLRLRQGDRQGAQAAWQEALRVDPANPIARGNLTALGGSSTAPAAPPVTPRAAPGDARAEAEADAHAVAHVDAAHDGHTGTDTPHDTPLPASAGASA